MSSWISRLGLPDVLFATALLLALLAVLMLAARRGASSRRLLGLGLFGGYLVLLAMIILCPLPGPVPEPAFPGAAEAPLLQLGTEVQLRGMFSSGLNDQNLQNLFLGVPFGLGLPFVLRRGGLWLAGACLLLGPALEGTQAVASLLAGWAYRSIDVNDLITNDLGALLGLLLFAILNRLFALRPGPSGRTVVVGTPIALSVVTFGLLAGPQAGLNLAFEYCEQTPADSVAVEEYFVFAEHDVVCLTHANGFSALFVGDPTPSVDSPREGVLNVVGLAPTSTVAVQADLADGQSAEATPFPVEGMDAWLVYVVPLRPSAGDDFGIRVTTVAADGSRSTYPNDR